MLTLDFLGSTIHTHPFGARVSITTDDGVHERLHADPSGEPTSFPDAQAMAQKFLTLARDDIEFVLRSRVISSLSRGAMRPRLA